MDRQVWACCILFLLATPLLGAREVIDSAIEAMKDPATCRNAIAQVARMGTAGAKAAPALAQVLRTNVELRPTAAEALVRIGATATLTAEMRTDADVRQVGVAVLVRMKAAAELADMLHDGSAKMRAAGVTGLRETKAIGELVKAVADDRADVRAAALGAVRELKGQPAVIEAMRESASARARIIAALVETKAADVLLLAAHDPSLDLRRAAVTALQQIKAIDELASLVKRGNAELAQAAAAAMTQLRANDALAGVMREAKGEGRRLAAATLVRLSARAELAALMREADPEVRKIAIASIVELNGVDELIQAVGDERPELRTAALKALAEMKAMPRLIEAMRKDADLRQSAMATLAQMKAKAELALAMRDVNADVRSAATWELVQLKAVPELIEGVNENSDEVRRTAIESLLQLEAMPTLTGAMRNDARLRQRAIGTLLQMKAAAELAQMLSDTSADLRSAAVAALVQLNAVPQLGQALGGNDVARRAAIAGLLRLQAFPRLLDVVNGDERICRQVAAALADQRAANELSQMLTDPNAAPHVRKIAAAALITVGSPSDLAAAMSTPNAAARAAVGAAIARHRRESVKELNSALRSLDADTRKDAAAAMLEVGAIHELAAAAGDANGEVRRTALGALARRKSLAAVADLLHDGRKRHAIMETLSDMDDAAALTDMAREYGAEIRETAMSALVRMQAAPQIVTMLADPRAEVRDAAIGALVKLKAASELMRTLRNFTPEVREAGITALAQLGNDAVPMLLEGLQNRADDRRSLVRPAAAKALGQIDPAGAPTLVPGLLELLHSEEITVRELAAQALAGCGKPAINGLLTALRDADDKVRKAAGTALAAGGPESLKAVAPLLASDDTPLREAAVRVMSRAGSVAVPALVDMLGKPGTPVAAESLGAMGTRAKDAVARLTLVMSATGDANTRHAVAAALVKIGPRVGDPALTSNAAQLATTAMKLLGEKDTVLQAAGCLMAASLGSSAKDAAPALAALAKDPAGDADVAAEALRALAEVAGMEAMEAALPAAADRVVAAARRQSMALRKQFMREWPLGMRAFEGILCALMSEQNVAEANAQILSYADGGARGGDIYSGSANVGYTNHLWVRILCLFHGKSPFYPGRLSAEAEKHMKAHYWRYLQRRGGPGGIEEGGKPRHTDLIEDTTTYLALGVLKDDPEFAERKFEDGTSCAERHVEWNAHFKDWLEARASAGCWFQIGSSLTACRSYPAILNLADLAPDPGVRQRATMFLDLAFIEEEQVSIAGARGGFKHHAGRGTSSNIDQWKDVLQGIYPRRHLEPCDSATAIVWSSQYQLPPAAILLRRLDPLPLPTVIANRFVGAGTNYAFKTPSYVLGCQLYEPAGARGPDPSWNGLMLDDFSAVCFPPTGGERFYAQHRSVQISQRFGGEGEARVGFSASLPRQERGRWIFVRAGGGYAAIRILGDCSWTSSTARNPDPEDYDVATAKNADTPVILQAGDAATFGSFEKFQEAVLSAPLTIEPGQITYAGPGEPVVVFYTTPGADGARRTPLIDGKPMQPYGAATYGSPYLSSDPQTGRVKVRVGSLQSEYDLSQGRVLRAPAAP